MVIQSSDKLPVGVGGGVGSRGMRGFGTIITLYSQYDLANTCVSLRSASP